MRRPGLTTQLFGAVLATAALVALVVSVAAQWNLERGVLGYLNDQAAQRLEAVLPRVRQAFVEHGGWDFVRGRRDVWFSLVGVDMARMRIHGDADGEPDQGLVESELLGAGRRLSLLDEQRQLVVGFPGIVAGSQQRQIEVDGRTVGWLAIAPIQTVTDQAALRFRDGQLQANLAMGGVAVLLAALIAWWVARTLLAPVRVVAAATHRLAAGAYDTRVAVQGPGEVGQLAQDFNQLAQTLQRNEQMRRDYMADVSHELRTPLAVLRGELEAMEDGVHPVTPEALRLLQSEVSMLSQLVTDLHELALADRGALTYRRIELDLGELLDHEVQLARTAAAGRQLQVELERTPGEVLLHADEARLRQLLHNVLGNAVRYTDPGGCIRVALQRQGNDAVIDVQDTKPGVTDDMLPRLFERFFRAEGSRGRAGGGSGLGLAICRSIVQAHGGHVEARHSPLGGVWVHIRLPMMHTTLKAAP